jgi:AraC-like DNA-binding protein
MLGFFLSDELIRETMEEMRGRVVLNYEQNPVDFTATMVETTDYLEGYFHSMLTYFRGIDRPPDHILVLKLKELLVNLINSDPLLTAYFNNLADSDKPSLQQVMENNYCFKLRLEDYADLCHRSLSTFKRDFQQIYQETPGKWIMKRRVERAANMLVNSSQSITEVAFETGFEDLSHFSRVFKQITGKNPTEYKKSLSF